MISLIIPTYNRPNVLYKTIDSYICDNISQIIIVDDGSSSVYNEVIEKIKKFKINFKYVKNKKRLGLPLSRNIGIDNVSYDSKFVFFGEDDVFLAENTVNIAFEFLNREKADIVGCNVKYLSGEDYRTYLEPKLKFFIPQKYEDIIKMKSIHIAKKEVYKNIKFDTKYIVNSYREETDFFLTAHKSGYKIIFIENYLGFNLPRKECNFGGEWEFSPVLYEFSAIYNNFIFYIKHFFYFRKNLGIFGLIKEILKFSIDRVKILMIKLRK